MAAFNEMDFSIVGTVLDILGLALFVIGCATILVSSLKVRFNLRTGSVG